MVVNKDLPECPVATAIGVIGNKWKLLILRNLLISPQRFTALLNGIDGISKKVLTENLRSLEDDGIVNRKTYAKEIPVKVEYSLSELGETLKPIFDVLTDWGNNYKEFIKNVSGKQGIMTLTYPFPLVIVADNIVENLPHLKLMRDMKPMPILVISSKYNASEKLEAIQLGADEYLAYPSTVEEAVASGKALIRRYTVLNHQAEKPLTIITYHDLFMCIEYRKLFLKGKEIELTQKEFDILHLLLSSIGRVYTHEQIHRHVWVDETDNVSTDHDFQVSLPLSLTIILTLLPCISKLISIVLCSGANLILLSINTLNICFSIL